MLLRVGWHLAVRDYPGMTLEITWPRFDGGDKPLSNPIERHVAWLALTPER
jgi:hypothetical protein